MEATNAQWLERFLDVMPWGSGTCSKAITYAPDEPSVIARGKGCRVWDADGREFIDFRNGLGPITLGFAYPEVNEAISAQLEKGILFGHPTMLECEVAEIVCQKIPCAERARFLKTGGEACAACVRIARAFTGRDHIVQIGYNGWLNGVAQNTRVLPGQTSKGYPGGVPAAVGGLFHACDWNDYDAVSQAFDAHKGQIAAVMVSCNYDNTEEGKTFYPFLRKITEDNGALLICDEIVMGMRVTLGGAHEYFGFMPDLAVLSKGIANGMPLAVYTGRREVMDACDRRPGAAIVSSTFAGEALSLAAAKACFSIYEREDVVGFLWKQGKRMWDGLNEIFKSKGLGIRMQGFYPIMPFVFEDASLKEPFIRAAYNNGVSLYSVGGYVNFSHKDKDIDEALQRLSHACDQICK